MLSHCAIHTAICQLACHVWVPLCPAWVWFCKRFIIITEIWWKSHKDNKPDVDISIVIKTQWKLIRLKHIVEGHSSMRLPPCCHLQKKKGLVTETFFNSRTSLCNGIFWLLQPCLKKPYAFRWYCMGFMRLQELHSHRHCWLSVQNPDNSYISPAPSPSTVSVMMHLKSWRLNTHCALVTSINHALHGEKSL